MVRRPPASADGDQTRSELIALAAAHCRSLTEAAARRAAICGEVRGGWERTGRQGASDRRRRRTVLADVALSREGDGLRAHQACRSPRPAAVTRRLDGDVRPRAHGDPTSAAAKRRSHPSTPCSGPRLARFHRPLLRAHPPDPVIPNAGALFSVCDRHVINRTPAAAGPHVDRGQLDRRWRRPRRVHPMFGRKLTDQGIVGI